MLAFSSISVLLIFFKEKKYSLNADISVVTFFCAFMIDVWDRDYFIVFKFNVRWPI